MFRDGLVGDDGGAYAGPQRRHAGAERGQHIAADHDVIGAITQRDVDDGGVLFQRRGHGAAPAEPVAASLPHNRACSAATTSSTIFSCGTSREAMVRSALP